VHWLNVEVTRVCLILRVRTTVVVSVTTRLGSISVTVHVGSLDSTASSVSYTGAVLSSSAIVCLILHHRQSIAERGGC